MAMMLKYTSVKSLFKFLLHLVSENISHWLYTLCIDFHKSVSWYRHKSGEK